MAGKIGPGGSASCGQAATGRLTVNAEVLLLAAGLLFCAAAALGWAGSLCLTCGCELYQGFTVLGLSLYIWGAVAFGAALVVNVLGLTIYRRLILICLWGEIVLLAW